MNINKLLSECNIYPQYDIVTTNDFIISQAPYINSCEELETLYAIYNKSGNPITDLKNQNAKFLYEYFDSNSHKNNLSNENIIDDIVIDNFLFGILVISAIIMFIFILPPN